MIFTYIKTKVIWVLGCFWQTLSDQWKPGMSAHDVFGHAVLSDRLAARPLHYGKDRYGSCFLLFSTCSQSWNAQHARTHAECVNS